LDVYFKTIEHKFEAVSAAHVSLMLMLRPIAYRLISEGSQALNAPEIKREFRKVIARQKHHQQVGSGEVLNALILYGLLVPDTEGRVGFFHQTALEYVAAVELLSRYSKGSVSVRKLLGLRRWDETIILFIALLPGSERRRVLQEVSEIDIIFACHAFESATVKDGSIGLSLFDILAEKLSGKRLPTQKRKLLARAAIGLAPYGRKPVLAKWLDDKDEEVASSAAAFLGLMGAKEFVPRFISKLRKERVWPSKFAKALELLVNESVVKALVKAGETSRGELAQSNFADVLQRFESDEVYSEVKRLSRSRTSRKRKFAVRILSNFESNRSVNILEDMLQDSNAEVRDEVIFGLEHSRAPHKTNRVIARMFNLLADRDSGQWAADFLISVSDASIILEAERRIASPINAHEFINLCAILARLDPNTARSLLFEKLDDYKPSFHDSLVFALAKLPVDCLLPNILSFLRSENDSLRSTVLDTLDWVRRPGEQLPISKKDCEYLVRLWERPSVQNRADVSVHFTFLLGDAFQSIAKPLLLKRLSNPKYKLRVQLLPIISRMPLAKGDLSSAMIEWVLSEFKIGLPPYEWPPGEIVGMVAGESMVSKKLIPLLLSSNPNVRNNAYRAIRAIENRLGRRLLKE
jgi:HEAT repeat protein